MTTHSNLLPLLPSPNDEQQTPVASRRQFVLRTIGAVSALATPAVMAMPAPVESVGTALTASKFRMALRSEFSAVALGATSSDAPAPISLTLTDVTSRSISARSAVLGAHADKVFSLKFVPTKIPPQEPLRQATFWLQHAELGEFAVLLVPSASGRTLRAEFHTA